MIVITSRKSLHAVL